MSLNKKNSNFTIHFIGIGGIGMSGIAELMLDQGYIIQGSDLVLNATIKRLRDRGIKIFLGHKKSNINNNYKEANNCKPNFVTDNLLNAVYIIEKN